MSKRHKIIYWIATIWLSFGMAFTAARQLMKMNEEIQMMTNLGYPDYILSILGVWKILGAIAVLLPKFPLLKEWAYAGFFFLLAGAWYAHLAVGDPIVEFMPSLLLFVLLGLSWYYRPAQRRLP